MEFWRSVFKIESENITTVYSWMEEKWSYDNPCKFRLGHAGRIIIEGKRRDDVFKVSEWIRNRNPLNIKLNYSVIGYEKGRIKYISFCKKCKFGKKPHWEHEREKD